MSKFKKMNVLSLVLATLILFNSVSDLTYRVVAQSNQFQELELDESMISDDDLAELEELPWSQDFEIVGQIIDIDTKNPISMGEVILNLANDTTLEVLSNNDGQFKIEIPIDLFEEEELSMLELFTVLSGSSLSINAEGYIKRDILIEELFDSIINETVLNVEIPLLKGNLVDNDSSVITGILTLGNEIMVNHPVALWIASDDTISYTNEHGRFMFEVQLNTNGATLSSNVNYSNENDEILEAISGNVEIFTITDNFIEKDLALMLIGVASDNLDRNPTTHYIYTAADLNNFLLGTLGTNYDNFVLMNDIVATGRNGVVQSGNLPSPNGGNNSLVQHHMGRPAINGESFTGSFVGSPDFINEHGRVPEIHNLRLRPRTNSQADTPGGHLANPSNNLGLNDFGFIRVLGDGAELSNIRFMNAYFYDGGTGSGPLLSNNHTTISNNSTGNNGILAQNAGGHGPQSNGVAATTVRQNLSTHRGIVAGRVLPNSNVTINNVSVGSAIGNLNHNERVTTAGHAINNVSASRFAGLWNGRISGFISVVEPGATVNITDADISVRMFHQTLGSFNQMGGVVATNRGTLNLSNVNVAAEGVESNWGHTGHTNHTIFAGAVVAENAGTINFNGHTDRNNIHLRTIREASTSGFSISTGNTNRGHFGDVGRLVGHASGPVNFSNVNLTGNIFGVRDIGGAIGFSSSAVTLSNITSTGTIGGTSVSFSNNNVDATRPFNAGGLVGRSTSVVNINNSNVDAQIFGSRGTNIITATTGGFVANAHSAIINNSILSGGSLNDTLNSGNGGNTGGFIGRATGAVSIYNSETRNAIMQSGSTHARARNAGRGGFIGLVATTGTVHIENSQNRIEVNGSRGDIGGFIGRMQGRYLNINNSINYSNVSIQGNAIWWDEERSAGGFVGNVINSKISINDSINDGSLSGTSRRRGMGGFVGHSTGASSINLTNVINNGDITRSSSVHSNVGGLLGWMRGNVTIEDSQNNGHMLSTGAGNWTSENTLAGLVGRVDQTLHISNSVNYANITNVQNVPMRVGGLVGETRGRVHIIDSENFGTVASTSSRINNHSVIGGIIGRVRFTNPVNNRRLILDNVKNHGNIGFGINSNSANENVGGIIGHTFNANSSQLQINNASNYGTIRGRQHVGGIIGFNDTVNLTINSSENHGNIHSHWATNNARGHIGGLVGRNSRNGLNITQSFNSGTVSTLSNSGHGSLTNTSTGGLIGNRSAGNVIISESFNVGEIIGVDRNTGGLVGLTQGSGLLTIQNTFNLGTITTRTSGSGAVLQRRQRSGNGILGFRSGGNVVIENTYNAGLVQGRPIYGSAASAANSALGNYITFRNVYFDSSIHRGVDQTISRGTISGVSTDMLTRSSLSGLTGNSWLNGMQLFSDETKYLNTYPYLAWQTSGKIETQFLNFVRDSETNQSFTDFEQMGQRDIEISIPDGFENEVKYFSPYISTINNHFSVISSTQSMLSINEDNLKSIGVISENWVVGFDISDRTGIMVVAIDEITQDIISWAQIDVDGANILDEINGAIVLNEIDVDGLYLNFNAFGYEDLSHFISYEDYVDNPTGVHFVPMIRVEIPYVRVEIRENINSNPVIANSWLNHERVDLDPFGPNQIPALSNPSPRHFMIDNFKFNDILIAGAPQFDIRTSQISKEDFVYISNQPSIANPHIIHLYLNDISLPDLTLSVVWMEPIAQPTENQDNPMRVNVNRGGSNINATNIVGSHTPLQFINPDGTTILPTSSNVGGANGSQYLLRNTTLLTDFRIGASGFRMSEFTNIGDLLEFNDSTDETSEGSISPNITIELERLIRLTVNVVEITGTNDTGDFIFSAPTTMPILEFSDGLENVDQRTLSRTSNNVFTVTGVEGEQLVATAPGYNVAFHVIDYLDDVTTRHSTSNNFIGSTGTITMILTPIEEMARTVIFDYSPGAYYGTVNVRINGEETGNIIAQLPGTSLSSHTNLDIELIENNGIFSHWSSPQFPNQTFTTSEIMNIELTNSLTYFTANFNFNQHSTHTLTLNLYDGSGDNYVIPVVLGNRLIDVLPDFVVDRVEEQSHNQGWAFWGWFTNQQLNSSGRIRNDYRRPSVTDDGIDLNSILSQEMFILENQIYNIDLYSIWALWGDVNDDDEVDYNDFNLLRDFLVGFSVEIVKPAAKVTRNSQITFADLNLLRQYLAGFEDTILGQE